MLAVIKQQKLKEDSRKLRAFAWSKTDQEGKLIGPGFFTFLTSGGNPYVILNVKICL